VANNPADINFCDADNNGFNVFDLNTDVTPQILLGQAATDFEVLYFSTAADATANVTGTTLPNPFANPTAFSSQTIHARIHNKNNTDCFALTDFILSVTDLPIPLQPTVYRLCDDTASTGGDTDGITTSFLLNTKDPEILGTLVAAQYNVSYHTALIDAQTSSATNPIDKTVGYTVNTSQTIFVRVENIDNVDCNAISDNTTASTFSSFELIVDPLPIIANNPALLEQCDDNADLISTFNLTEAEVQVSNNSVNETFEYYATQADAIAGTRQVADVLRYPVIINGEAWARTISEFGCFRISQILLVVSFAGDVAYDRELEACDDLLDFDGNDTPANSDTDGITFFDFSEARQDVISLFTPLIQPDLEVFFYETLDDRTASINELTNIANHRNNKDPTYAANQTIYIRIVNTVNNNCTGIGQLFLITKQTPITITPDNFELCDDSLSGSTTDGQNTSIDLREKVSEILGSTQTETDFIVTFHLSQAGADDTTNTGIANDTNFTSTPQTGFVAGDISEQTIFVRVQNRNVTPPCYNSQVSFKIIIEPLPLVIVATTPLAFCDVPTTTDSDPRNRVAQNIDLTQKNAEIFAGRTTLGIAYYTSAVDAINRNNEITTPADYESNPLLTTFPINFNTDQPGVQTIFFVLVDQLGFGCSSVFATFELLIYPEPNIPVNISNYSDCDNVSDANQSDENGINGDIALVRKTPEILDNYDPLEFDDYKVTFYTSQAAAESGDATFLIDENIYENTSNNQTVYVRVENIKNTPVTCVHARLSFDIIIKPKPFFTVLGEKDIDAPLTVCIIGNPGELILAAENYTEAYNYVWTNSIGAILGTSETLIVTTGGEYTVTASDISPAPPVGCQRSKTIVVKESAIAVFGQEDIAIIDEATLIGSENKRSIHINTISQNLGIGDYVFKILNNDTAKETPSIGFQDSPLFENLDGGIYTITIRDNYGCKEDATLAVSVLQFPKFFTPNNDGTNDTWSVKGVNKDFYTITNSIHIFNRYGKLVAKIPVDSNAWDGTYNGKLLSSDDYWFHVT
jgi:gliding motility-associated-like protein